MRTYRVIELFSGVGAQRMALERLKARHPDKLDFQYVAQCDIDRYAVRSYDAIHGETPNLGDVTQIERLPDCDILTWSFPCTDISLAGKKAGMKEGSGTRSGLCWEVVRLLECSHRPEWLLMENVPAVLFKTNKPEFDRLCKAIEDLGYRNSYQVLNAVDFNIAQNRKRCYMISHLDAPCPEFPRGGELQYRLRDYLEAEVDRKYYLSPERLKGMILSSEKEKDRGNGFRFDPVGIDTERPAKTIQTRGGGRKDNNYLIENDGESCRIVGTIAPSGKITQHTAVRTVGRICMSLCASDYKTPPPLFVIGERIDGYGTQTEDDCGSQSL